MDTSSSGCGVVRSVVKAAPNPWWKAAALCGFVGLVFIVGLHHEPWFDEAQAWLIARDNSPWRLVTTGVRYEGTPALWHLLLYAVQRLGLPYAWLFLVSGALACAGAAIVLYLAPFPIWMRLGVIFSYFFAYQYSVVARSYALDLLLIPLAAALFSERLRRPLAYTAVLALMANTNAHSFMLAAALALEAAWTGRTLILKADPHVLCAVALFAIASAGAAFQAFPPPDINFVIRKHGDTPFLHALQLATEAFIDRGDIFSTIAPNALERMIGGALTLAALAPAAVLFARARQIWLAAALFGGLIGFSALKYGNFWHAGIIFLAFVFCLWTSWTARAALRPRMRLALTAGIGGLLSVHVYNAAAAAASEVSSVYSPAGQVAELLRTGIQNPSPTTIGVAGFKAFAVQPYFPRNIFANYEKGDAKPAYYLWRRGEAPIPGLNEASWRATAAAGYDRLLLSSFNLMGVNGPARYSADARRAGYCETAAFFGEMIWKTYTLETDQMMVFDHCRRVILAPRLP